MKMISFYGGPLDGAVYPETVKVSPYFDVDGCTHLYEYVTTVTGEVRAEYRGMVARGVAL